LMELHLRAEGFRVRGTGNGEEAIRICREESQNIVVLDVMLPGKTGLEVCTALQELENRPGVIMVTARGSESDVIVGLDAGADDYVVKPIRPREVTARVRALARRLARRSDPDRSARTIIRGDLTIDLDARLVSVRSSSVALTPKEFDVLVLLAGAPHRVFSRMELLFEVWDTDHEGYARNVDTHVMRVRRKLGAAGFDVTAIETKHGSGYRFRA